MTTQQIVALLNEIAKNDPHAAHNLVEQRIPVDNPQWFADHRTLVIDASNKFGLLGLLNGIAGLDGEVIEAIVDDTTMRVIGFQVREKQTDAYAEAAV